MQLTDVLGLAPDESGAGPEPQPPIAVEDAESWLGTVFDHALTELKKNDPKQAALDAFNEIKKTIPEVAEAMANWEPDSLGDWVSAFAEVGLGAIFDSLALAWNTGWELGSIITELRRAYRDYPSICDPQLAVVGAAISEKLVNIATEARGRLKKVLDRITAALGRKKKKDDDYDYKDCKGTAVFGGRKLDIPQCGKTKGKWSNPKKPGDSIWKPHPGTALFNALAQYGKAGIKFKKGYPVFEPLAYTDAGPKAIVDIGRFNNPKNRPADMRKARDAYRQMLKDRGVDKWESWPWPPKNSKGNAPMGWTWHHHEDGNTMVLVPTDVHDLVRHCGGISCL